MASQPQRKKTGTLRDRLIRQIAAHGPIGIEAYMSAALTDPEFGYYMTRDPLGRSEGRGGDFITAPEVSQMFGELIGLWLASEWQRMGAPDPVRLVELGPGRGTLMADALRTMAVMPELLSAADLHLVEASPLLMAKQRERLQANWCESLAQVPEGPLLLVANEFFDALPIRQFVMTDEGWRQRLVSVENGELRFAGGERATDLKIEAGMGDIFEASPASTAIVREIAGRLAECGGAALIIDYGHSAPGLGDTLQAVRGHQYADVLAEPGEADLTTHVDFAALAEAARSADAGVHGPVAQGAFLTSLGIEERARKLSETADPGQRSDIETALERLTSAGAMGELFKVMALTDRAAPAPAGFE